MTTNEEKRQMYYDAYQTENPSLGQLDIKLYVLTADIAPYYIADEDGASVLPYFVLRPSPHVVSGSLAAGYSLACVIKKDLSDMTDALVKTESASGTFWKFQFAVGISFGGTELSARVIWTDAKVLYPAPAFKRVALSFRILGRRGNKRCYRYSKEVHIGLAPSSFVGCG